MKGEDLKEHIMRFNLEDVLISNLQDRVAHPAFLNELLSVRFKLSFAGSRVTFLAKALGRANTLFKPLICAGGNFI